MISGALPRPQTKSALQVQHKPSRIENAEARPIAVLGQSMPQEIHPEELDEQVRSGWGFELMHISWHCGQGDAALAAIENSGQKVLTGHSSFLSESVVEF